MPPVPKSSLSIQPDALPAKSSSKRTKKMKPDQRQEGPSEGGDDEVISLSGALEGSQKYKDEFFKVIKLGDLKTSQDLLLKEGRSLLSGQDNQGVSPLMMSIQGQNMEVMRLLLEWGADANELSLLQINSLTILHYVISKGSIEEVKLLVKHGADINSRGPLGRTPVCWAADRGKVEIMEWLMQQGADLTLKSDTGAGLLMAAMQSPYINANFKVIKSLIDKRVERFDADNFGWTPIGWATSQGYRELVEYIVQAGITLEQCQVAHQYASVSGRPEITDFLNSVLVAFQEKEALDQLTACEQDSPSHDTQTSRLGRRKGIL